MKVPDKQLGVKASSHHRPVVKNKASTKFIGRRVKHPVRWGLVKDLSQAVAEVSEMIQGTNWPVSQISWH
jgi:hypothetical protein